MSKIKPTEKDYELAADAAHYVIFGKAKDDKFSEKTNIIAQLITDERERAAKICDEIAVKANKRAQEYYKKRQDDSGFSEENIAEGAAACAATIRNEL